MVQAIRIEILFLASTSLVLAGCNVRPSVPTKEITLSGVTFVIPEAYHIDESSNRDGVAYFEFEGLPGEIRDGRFSVLGKDYGSIKQGDVVTFHRDGTFQINGHTSESTSVAANTIESKGVLFMIRGEILNKDETSETGVTFEDSAGRAFKIESGSVTIDGFTHGPFAKGNVVKVSHDAAITVYP